MKILVRQTLGDISIHQIKINNSIRKCVGMELADTNVSKGQIILDINLHQFRHSLHQLGGRIVQSLSTNSTIIFQLRFVTLV